MTVLNQISNEEWATRFPEPPDSEKSLAEIGKLEVGQIVSGEIVARAHYGLYLDLGIGIFAILLGPRIKDFDSRYFDDESVLPLGAQIDSYVLILRKKPPTIALTQQLDELERTLRPWWKIWK